MSKEERVLNCFRILCKGRRNSVNGKDLQAIFDLSNREVRRIISDLRLAGHPICSNTVDGYFYAETEQEIIETINDYNSRIAVMQDVVTSLNKQLRTVRAIRAV